MKNVNRKSWDEFRNTGLLLIINQILHIFGWAIVFEMKGSDVRYVYPARIKFRGFDEVSIDEAYTKVSKYLKDNSEELYNETKRL